MSLVMPALLVVASVMGAGMILPQVLRFRRTRSADGVSGAWVGVGVAINAWWIVYAVAESLWGLVPVSVVAFVLYCMIACQYAALAGRGSVRGIAAGVLATGALPVPFLLAGGWPAAGLCIGLVYAVQYSPAAVTAVRAVDLRGISPVTWTMAFVEAGIWFVYGLVEADVALLVGGAGGTVLSGIVLVCLLRLSPALRVAAEHL